MLQENAFLFNATGGPGSYQVDINFSNASRAQYLAPGDIVTDRTGNRYRVDSPSGWVGYPTNFSNNGTANVTFVDADVAPTNSLALGDASVETEGQIDPEPQVQTGGSVLSSVLLEGRNYLYRVNASWFIGSEANAATTGDRFIDNTGKVFEITALSGQPNAFSQPFEAQEVDRVGISPNAGNSYLFRGTPNLRFYQGQQLSQLAEDAVRNRDEYLTDLQFVEQSGAGGGIDNITVVSGSFATITSDDSLILVENSGATNLSLSGVFPERKQLFIKDAFVGANDRSVNIISIIPTTGTIDGQLQLQIVNNGQAFTIVNNQGSWFII